MKKNEQFKNSGVRYWKDFFNDLKPFDKINLDELLTRHHNTLLSFDNFNPDNDWFFIPIKKQSDLEENSELLRLHKKFNSPNAVIEKSKNKRIAFSAYGKSPYLRSHYSKGGEGGIINSHQNWKDGMIRPGLNISNWDNITKRLMKGNITNEFIYLEIPYKIILDFLEVNHTNHPMKIPKQFVTEIEKTKNGWKDDDSVNKLIDEYDKKYPNWNFDFPVFGYTSFIKYGTLFPTFYFGHKIFKNGTHRMYNTCLSKSDVPIFINVPTKNLNKFDKLIIDKNKFMIFTAKLFSKFQDEYSRLFISIDCNERIVEYYLSDDDVYGVRYGRFKNKKYLGYSEF
tara:strand:+ start:15410 stop:16429 length:1020 start_codon:yes stop_codon:yes gene_type:complete